MNVATRQLLLLGAVLSLLALVIGWSAVTSWREIRELRSSFTSAQLESFRIADLLQAGLLKLDSYLLKYHEGRLPEDWRSFEDESRRLSAWINQQKTDLSTPKEKAALSEINDAFDSYLAAASEIAADTSGSEKFRIEAAEQRLINLGMKLRNAHREALDRFMASSQQSLALLQTIIFMALLALVLLLTWAVVVVYHTMIAPLRVRLVESQALVERHEKLAALGVLAAGVAHEIRNPLTAIKARLFTQLKALAPGSRERADAEFIGSEIDRLEKIVRDFLRFARPVEPERVPVSPAHLVQQVHQLMAPQLRASSIELTIERAVETRVLADPEQLKQVLINLVQNAAEALGKDGAIKLRAEDSRMALGGEIREIVIIEVEDNGTGIPPEVQKRLFDPFFTTKQNGTGLGLSIAARIVEKHAGALRFQTVANRGTTFGVALPLAP
jgi:signal transduction histidine kinase